MVSSLNLQHIDQEQALNLNKFFIKSGKNFFIMGQRGTGKTTIAMQAAKECGYKLNYINLSVIERPDLAGYPNINSDDEVVTFKSPIFLPELLSNKPDTVILFDEVDKAAPEITAPLLEILQFRTINGKKINAAACILTSNLPSEKSYHNQISSTLLDRCAKYSLDFNFDKWLEWCKQHNIHDLILGFLRNNPNFACTNADDSAYASPSPRGWCLASEALDQAKQFKIYDIESITSIISGFVGFEVGLKFKIWYEYFRRFEPSINSLIDSGAINIDFNKLNQTEKMVFVISTCYTAKQKCFSSDKKKFKYLENLCDFLVNFNIDKELQVIGLSNSFSFEQITEKKLYTCKPFFDLYTKINENLSLKK